MEKTQQIKTKKGQVLNLRKTQRNDPCPCGRTMIIVDQYGQEFERPFKFKHCCLHK